MWGSAFHAETAGEALGNGLVLDVRGADMLPQGFGLPRIEGDGGAVRDGLTQRGEKRGGEARHVGQRRFAVARPRETGRLEGRERVAVDHLEGGPDLGMLNVEQPAGGDAAAAQIGEVAAQGGHVAKAFDLPPEAFSPPPKVTSSVMVMKPKDRSDPFPAFEKMEKVLAVAFQQRRKMVRSSLKIYNTQMEDIGLDQTLRAENLELQDYLKLAEKI